MSLKYSTFNLPRVKHSQTVEVWLNELHQLSLLQPLVAAVEGGPVVENSRAEDDGLTASELPLIPFYTGRWQTKHCISC